MQIGAAAGRLAAAPPARIGLIAYGVQERHKEIAAGILIGLALAAVLARSMSTFLFGVQPLDPTTFLSVAAFVSLTAAVAAAVPALRAVRLDPVVTLRSE